MNKGKKEKTVPLFVRIDPDIDKRLRELIALKYKSYRKGYLRIEIEEALRNWIALHTNTQFSPVLEQQLNVQEVNPDPRAYRVFYQVKKYLLSKYYWSLDRGQQVPLKHLREAIAAVRGCDPRTIEKWLRIFHKFKLIKPISGELWEIL